MIFSYREFITSSFIIALSPIMNFIRVNQFNFLISWSPSLNPGIVHPCTNLTRSLAHLGNILVVFQSEIEFFLLTQLNWDFTCQQFDLENSTAQVTFY